MSCCGKGREALRMQHNAGIGPARPAAAGGAQPAVIFEYTAQGSVSVVGEVTGVRYDFPSPGARARVDLRDRAQLLRTPGLRLLG